MSASSENPHDRDVQNSSDPAETVSPAVNDESSVPPQSVEGLFLQALKLSNIEQQQTFLLNACGDNSDLQQRVAALLRAYDDAGSFLETPVAGPHSTDELSLSFLKPIDKEGVRGTIGAYEVLDVVGRGGMGVVLRAVDPKLNRIVAVKVLLPELAANPNSRRRFLREAQAAAAISHPHVVTIHAVDDSHEDAQGTQVPPYLVMEFVAGQSLQQKLDRVGTLRLAEILRIGRQIAEGLAAAHKQGVIHRDIKPANILLENGVERVKLTDFGLARAIDDITVTRTGEVSGTPQYMSPEQANGERVDHRSDLFSLGCVLYALCTGHSPFRGENIAHVIKRVTQDKQRAIADQNPEIPAWLAEIIDCLLQKDPEQRFQSAEGVAAILDDHLKRIQQPTESGSHSVINRQVPVSHPIEQSSQPESYPASRKIPPNHIRVPSLVQSIARIMIAVSVAALTAIVGIGQHGNSGIGPSEAGMILLMGAWPVLMASMLCRRHMSREALLAALFLGLGPLGLVIYLFLSDKLLPATDADIAPPISRYQVGTWLAGGGALIIFSMIAWFVLVGFEIIDASQIARQNANLIFAISLLAAILLIVPGMLLRGEILGNQPVSALFSFSSLTLLGPLGIWWWMSQQKKGSERNVHTPPFARQHPHGLTSHSAADSIHKPAVEDPKETPRRIGIMTRRWWWLVAAIGLTVATLFDSARQTVALSEEDSHKAVEFVAQRFHRPVISVQSIGNNNAVIVLKSESGQNELIHLARTPTGLWGLDSAHHATTIEIGKGDTLGPANDEWGGLILEIPSSGTYAAVMGLGPRIVGEGFQLLPAGRHKLPVGRYNLMIIDTQAGWLADVKSRSDGEYSRIFRTIDTIYQNADIGKQLYDADSGTYSIAQYSATPHIVTIGPGEFTAVEAHRNLKKIADTNWTFNRDANERFLPGQFYRFLWNGEKYALTAIQARVVDVLLHSMADDTGPLSQSQILARVFPDDGSGGPNDLAEIFNNGKHPGWDHLIQQDNATALFSLSPLK